MTYPRTFFSKPLRPPLVPTQPPIKGHRNSLPEVKRLGREVDHLNPSSAEVKNEWSYTPTPPPPTSFHGVQRNKFAFTSTPNLQFL